MRKRLFSVFLIFGCAWAQPALAPPHLGFLVDGGKHLRPVYGVAGAFVVGQPAASGVVSSAFGGSFGLLKTGSAVTAFDRMGKPLASIAVGGGPALFAFSADGAAGLAYLTGANELLEFEGAAFTRLSFDGGRLAASAVLSVAMPDRREASFLVQREDGLWEVRIRLAGCDIFSHRALNGVTAPVLALAAGELVFGDESGVVVLRPDGSRVHISARLPRRFELQQMGEGWIRIVDRDRPAHYAVRITPGREGFYALPEAGP